MLSDFYLQFCCGPVATPRRPILATEKKNITSTGDRRPHHDVSTRRRSQPPSSPRPARTAPSVSLGQNCSLFIGGSVAPAVTAAADQTITAGAGTRRSGAATSQQQIAVASCSRLRLDADAARLRGPFAAISFRVDAARLDFTGLNRPDSSQFRTGPIFASFEADRFHRNDKGGA